MPEGEGDSEGPYNVPERHWSILWPNSNLLCSFSKWTQEVASDKRTLLSDCYPLPPPKGHILREALERGGCYF